MSPESGELKKLNILMNVSKPLLSFCKPASFQNTKKDFDNHNDWNTALFSWYWPLILLWLWFNLSPISYFIWNIVQRLIDMIYSIKISWHMCIIKLKCGTLAFVNHLSSNVNTDHSFVEGLLDNRSHYSLYLSAHNSKCLWCQIFQSELWVLQFQQLWHS